MSESTRSGATEEAEAFAELLRGLKERSGLSYGALAKRLHMSDSTLHRYCNGIVVPTEYAPVERIARKCRATGEELVELHRRWVLADATRTRRGPGQDGREPEGTGPERTAPASDSSEPCEPDECDEPVVSDAVPSVPPPARTRLRWSRRRHTLITCAVAIAALGSVVLAAGLPFSGDDDRGRIRAGDDTWDLGTDEDVSPIASTLPSPPRDTKSGKSPAPGSGDHDSPPVKVTTRPYVYDDPCGQRFLVDSEPGQVGPPATEQDAPQWAAAFGAVPSGEQRIALTVLGPEKGTVALEALHVRVIAKGNPLPWTDYSMGVGCGDSVKARSFDVDLDKSSPSVTAKNGQRNFPFTVSASDAQVIHVTAHTSEHDVRWDLALDWSSGDRQGTVRVDNKGTAFRTAAGTDGPGYDYPLSGGGWVKRKG